AADRVLEVEAAERLRNRAAATVLTPHRIRDEQERRSHKHVPLPPSRVPVAREGDREQSLRQQDPRDDDRDEQEARAAAIELDVAPGSERVEDATGDRE